MWVLILFCIALNLDVLFAAFAYGIQGIRFSVFNIVLIVFIDCAMLAVSLFFGGLLYGIIDTRIMTIVGAVVLIALGVYNITISIIKQNLKKNDHASVFVDVVNADKDKNKLLSFKETLILAVVLGFDALLLGFSYGFSLTYGLIAVGIMFVLSGTSLILGNTLGTRFSKRSMVDLSWLGGVLLILIAVLRLVGI